MTRSIGAVGRPERASTFAYLGVDVDHVGRTLTCRYRSDGTEFSEVASFDESVDLGAPGVEAASVLYLLLAGLSYYKTGAARTVELGGLPAGPATRTLLAAAIRDGLGEFAYRNGLDLADVALHGGTPPARSARPVRSRGPLIPFGGGIDSIVTASMVARPSDGDGSDDVALFVVGPHDARFEAIERPARVAGLPIVRCARHLDAKVRAGSDAFFDGHVPVTSMVSALAIVAAIAQVRTGVVMSNERSASSPNLVVDGRPINHQWSKSLECEDLLRAALDEQLNGPPAYASALRDRSELWIAQRFAAMPEYLGAFMSCNRAFRQDPTRRTATWCGACDKCLFTNLVLAPFLDRATLEGVFAGAEPIGDAARVADLEVLVGLADNPKPFECVGDDEECAAALVAVAARTDRADQRHLAELAARCVVGRTLDALLEPCGRTNFREIDAAPDLL